jgi:hypothetical protein
MQPIQDRGQKLEESLVNRYEQNITKLTDFYVQRAKKTMDQRWRQEHLILP